MIKLMDHMNRQKVEDRMLRKQLSSLPVLTLMIALCSGQDKFQQCCGDRRLFYAGDGECYLPLQQGPCAFGEWIIMEKGGNGKTVQKSI